jgi:uncharacterized membrane protein YcgQ (UPF0703/DUF1980 family)
MFSEETIKVKKKLFSFSLISLLIVYLKVVPKEIIFNLVFSETPHNYEQTISKFLYFLVWLYLVYFFFLAVIDIFKHQLIKNTILNFVTKNIKGNYFGFIENNIYENNKEHEKAEEYYKANEFTEQDELKSIKVKKLKIFNNYQNILEWFLLFANLIFNFFIPLILGIIAVYQLHCFMLEK